MLVSGQFPSEDNSSNELLKARLSVFGPLFLTFILPAVVIRN